MINPKTKLSRYITKLAALAVVFGLLAPVAGASATGNDTLTMTPASGSYAIGSSLTITIYEDSGSDAVNAVQAQLAYDQTKLQLVSSNTSGSPFDLNVPHNDGSGSVLLSVAKIGGTYTGSQLVGTVTFTVLAGSGSSAISFVGGANGSAIVPQSNSSSNLWNGDTAGASFSFTGASSGGGGSSGGTSGGGTTTSGGTKSTTIPAPKTSPTSPSSPTAPPTASSAIVPTSQGYMVAVTVTGADGKPLVGANVAAGDATVKTDAHGVANFMSLAAGTYDVQVSSNGKTFKHSITVAATGQHQTAQAFQVKVAGASTLTGRWYVYLLSLLLIALILGGGLSLKRLMDTHAQKVALEHHGSISTQPVQSAQAPAPPSAASDSAQMFYPDPSAPKPVKTDKSGPSNES